MNTVTRSKGVKRLTGPEEGRSGRFQVKALNGGETRWRRVKGDEVHLVENVKKRTKVGQHMNMER